LFASLQSILNKHSITHGGGAVRYQSNHVKIINRGKTAAIDCKAFLVINTDSERVAWMLPTNKESFTNTLNVEDEEYVDLCAIEDNGTDRIILTKRGYGGSITAPGRVPGNLNARIRITSSNANKSERVIRIMDVIGQLTGDRHKIVDLLGSLVPEIFFQGFIFVLDVDCNIGDIQSKLLKLNIDESSRSNNTSFH